MANKEFNPLQWLDSQKPQTQKSSKSPIYSGGIYDKTDEIEKITQAIEANGVDITSGYTNWRDLGFALADELGEGGRHYFHRLSRFHPDYDEYDADKQYNACVNARGHGITIKTLFHLAKQAGVTIVTTQNPNASYESKSSTSSKSPISPAGEIEEIEENEETEPIDVKEEPMPTFSKEMYSLLPEFLGLVINKAKDCEDADLLIIGTLTAISACLPNVSGNYADREVYPNLFLFVVAQASAGKGRLTLCRHIVKPIHDNLKQLYAAEIDEFKHLQNEYVLDKKNNEPPQEPAIKTLLIPANSSATSVYQILNDNNGIGLIFETEGDTLANTFKSDYGNFSDGFRKAFHHEMISYTRRKDREFVELEKPRLSALLSGTPNQVLSLIPDAENGLFSRFMFYFLNLRLDWNNVFSDNQETLDEHFTRLGELFFKLYQQLQSSSHIRFSLSIPQQEEFNKFFSDLQEEYSSLYGLEIVASIRRLGLITFRIAMIFTTLRIMEGLDIAPVIVCNDIDFRNSLIMAKVLLQHTAKVYGNLPIPDGQTKQGGQTVINQLFYENLPNEFTRKKYIEYAKILKIPPKTADRYVSRLCEKGQLKRMSHGFYSKT